LQIDRKLYYDPSTGATFNDLELPLTQIVSTATMMNISETVQDRDQVTMEY